MKNAPEAEGAALQSLSEQLQSITMAPGVNAEAFIDALELVTRHNDLTGDGVPWAWLEVGWKQTNVYIYGEVSTTFYSTFWCYKDKDGPTVYDPDLVQARAHLRRLIAEEEHERQL